MKRIFISFFCLVANVYSVQAQTAEQYLAVATDAATRSNYAEAAEAYKIVLEDEAFAKNDAMLWATAENCRLSNSPKQALLYYKRIKTTDDFENYNQNMALIHKQLGDYTKANSFLQKLGSSPTVDLEMAGCAAAKALNTDKWQVKYINDKRLNSDAVADYYGFVYNKNLYFTSNRTTTNIGENPINIAALYFKKEEKVTFLREADIDKKTGYANACLANKGKWLIFAEAGYDAETHHWRSNLRFINKNTKELEGNSSEIPQKLNDSLFENATMPHWAKEGGRTFLYFVSDRSGGKGGMDIWRSEYDNGAFQQPENMLINTAADDITPFYHAATQTLYFSSKGLASQGGFDVYAATNYTYSEPKIALLPAPLNSSFDDFYFGFAETDSTGYLSSTRNPKMTKGENGLCCADIFSFKKRFTKPIAPPLADNPRPNTPPSRGFKPKTETTDSLPSPEVPTKLEPPSVRDTMPTLVTTDSTTTEEPPVVIETPPILIETPPVVVETPPVVIETPPVVVETPTPPVVKTTPPPVQKTIQVPPITSESTSITLYFHNDEPDPNTIKTTTSESYDQTYYRYIAMRRLYVKEYQKGVKAADKAMAADEMNAFFEQNVIGNFERLEATMLQIKGRLERGETVRIHISGHCSPRAASDYNIKLSKRRIVCMQNYVQRWQNRSLASYVKNKQLVIEHSPFGETTAPKHISDKAGDKRNSIFSPDASAERRVTVTVE